MTVTDLINRAYMQVGDTSQVTYTPYQFLEFYNEGNHLLHRLVRKFIPSLLVMEEYAPPMVTAMTLARPVRRIISVTAITGDEVLPEDYISEQRTIRVKNGPPIRSVTYDAGTGYAELDDVSGYPPEIESMLVQYMVSRILNLDMSFTATWETTIADMAKQLDSNGDDDSVLAEGYWPYDRRRIDYDD